MNLAACNKRKEKNLISTGKIDASEEEKSEMAFRDLTDIENPYFRYTY